MVLDSESFAGPLEGQPFLIARLGIAPALTDGVFVEDDPPQRIRDPNWMARSKQVEGDAYRAGLIRAPLRSLRVKRNYITVHF
jgi:hypothetical protein